MILYWWPKDANANWWLVRTVQKGLGQDRPALQLSFMVRSDGGSVVLGRPGKPSDSGGRGGGCIDPHHRSRTCGVLRKNRRRKPDQIRQSRAQRAARGHQARNTSSCTKPPTVYLIAGVNGSGKTTSIAKLAQYLKDQGNTILLAACDTFRAAAADQLSVWAGRAGCEIVKGAPGADPASVAHDACQRALARHIDVLIVDTAGRLHTQTHLMRELEKIRTVIQRLIPGAPHEVLLVIDATNGQNAIRQAEVFTKSIGCTGVILTKLDGTAKGGVVVAVRQSMNLPVKFVGVGEALDDLQPFDADTFVESLFL